MIEAMGDYSPTGTEEGEMSGLTDADVAFIKDAALSDLREELYYATGRDEVYAAALAKEIVRRTQKSGVADSLEYRP